MSKARRGRLAVPPAGKKMADYHDYVIRDGKFIGRFEDMYRDVADPWHQDRDYRLSEEIGLLLLAGRRYRRVLDIGCGLGRYTRRLTEITGGEVIALDVAPTAITKAARRYPEIDFRVADVPPLNFQDGSFDLVVTCGLLWYVLPKIEKLFAEIKRVLSPYGHYLVIQQFYLPGTQKYGTDVMQAPEDLLKFARTFFDKAEHIIIHRDGFDLMALLQRRDEPRKNGRKK